MYPSLYHYPFIDLEPAILGLSWLKKKAAVATVVVTATLSFPITAKALHITMHCVLQ